MLSNAPFSHFPLPFQSIQASLQEIYHLLRDIMKKCRVLQLGLQLGFPIATDICNSWYLYNLECYQTSCNNYNSCNGHLMSYTILYIRCNSHVTICNFFATNLHIIFPHTFQHGERNANVASNCQQMMYVNTFCNLFTTILQLILQI
jgi:hypothetical protein